MKNMREKQWIDQKYCTRILKFYVLRGTALNWFKSYLQNGCDDDDPTLL